MPYKTVKINTYPLLSVVKLPRSIVEVIPIESLLSAILTNTSHTLNFVKGTCVTKSRISGDHLRDLSIKINSAS